MLTIFTVCLLAATTANASWVDNAALRSSALQRTRTTPATAHCTWIVDTRAGRDTPCTVKQRDRLSSLCAYMVLSGHFRPHCLSASQSAPSGPPPRAAATRAAS